MIFDLSRARGPASAVLATAIALGCYGILLNTALGRQNKWLLERDNTSRDPDSIDLGARRTLGILRERATFGRAAGERLGVLVGASVLTTGVNPSLLTSEFAERYRWANLPTRGYPYDFNLIISHMYRHGLRPDALVLVMNPNTLAPRADLQEERAGYDPGNLIDHVGTLDVRSARLDMIAISLVPWNLAFPYRGQVYGLVNRSLLAAKLRVLDSLGMGLAGLYAPAPNPWYEDQAKIDSPDLKTDEEKRSYLTLLESCGWLDPDRYRSDGPNFALLVEIFRLAHAHGTRSFIVLVPEAPIFRAKLPPDDDYHLTHTLKETLGSAAPIVLDFGDFAPDAEFHNPAHLNALGSNHFTRGLADRLKPYLEDGSSARESKHR